MMEKSSSRNETFRKLAISAGVVTVALAAGFGIFHLLNSGAPEKKRVMDVVQLKLIPPPPPPKVEPPPEPPKMVEQKIQPPVDKPDDKPKDKAPDKPPPGPLALDAKGGPGSDAFGLGGKPGGSDYIGGDAGGGGNGWSHYSALMTDEIRKRMQEEGERVDLGKIRVTVRVWLTPIGKVDRFAMLHRAGDPATIEEFEKVMAGITFSEAPKPGMPTPIIRVGTLPQSESSDKS